VCNHAFHHNPAVWGDDHNRFDPSRWDEAGTVARGRYLMHFGLGGRQCVGKTIALTNIYKLASTLLREFQFEIVASDNEKASGGGGTGKRAGGHMPELLSVSVSELQYPLMVRVKERTIV